MRHAQSAEVNKLLRRLPFLAQDVLDPLDLLLGRLLLIGAEC